MGRRATLKTVEAKKKRGKHARATREMVKRQGVSKFEGPHSRGCYLEGCRERLARPETSVTETSEGQEETRSGSPARGVGRASTKMFVLEEEEEEAVVVVV